MKGHLTALIAAVAICQVPSAQTPPNFSGKWTKVSGPAAPVATIMHPPDIMTVAQDASTLSMESSSGRRWVFKLDGSESRNAAPNGGQGAEYVSKAKWAGEYLEISTPGGFSSDLFEPRLKMGPYVLLQVWHFKGGNLSIRLTPESVLNPAQALGEDVGTWVYSQQKP